MLRRAVLWDSSAVLALFESDEPMHQPDVEVFQWMAAEARPGVITNYLEVETHALLLRRVGHRIALDWLLHHGLSILRATSEEEHAARNLLASHLDKEWSLCDAIAFSVATARGITMAFSFDRHFRQFGRWQVLGV